MARAAGLMAEELPLVLARQGKSLRWLADELGVDISYLSKALRGVGGKVLTRDLVQEITRVLELPEDHFAEEREWRVIDAVRADARLREGIYRSLRS